MKKNRIIFWVSKWAVVPLILCIVILICTILYKNDQEKKAYESAMTKLEEVRLDLQNLQGSVRQFNNNTYLSIQALEDELNDSGVKLANSKLELVNVELKMNDMEKVSESEMRNYYEDAKKDLEEAKELFQICDVSSMYEHQEQYSTQLNAEYLDIHSSIEKYNNEELQNAIDSLYDEIESEMLGMKDRISGIERQYSSILEHYTMLENKMSDYLELIEQYEAFENMKVTLQATLNTMQISGDMDMSKPIGFTAEQLQYLLEQYGLIRNQQVLNTLPTMIVETVKEYPLNELFCVGVMCLETGYFQSALANNKHNYGGLLTSKGYQSFETMEEGMQETIKCIHRNLKGNNTIYEVNVTYCPPKTQGDYEWSRLILNIMRKIVTTPIK